MRYGLVIALILSTASLAQAQAPFGPPVSGRPGELPAAANPFAEGSRDRSIPQTKVVWVGPTAEIDQKLREKMTQETKIQFIDTPLEDVVNYLEALHGFNIVVSPKVPQSEDLLISLNIEGLRFDSTLSYMLEEHDLDWYIEGEILVVTTTADANARMSLRAYPLRSIDGAKLVEILEATVAPDTWKANREHGQLKLEEKHNTLLVWQNRRGHELVEATINVFLKHEL
ncbi:hypothetical protein DTL42_24745 [Bremerella cremea]|uniref:Uncharacterized protein n=1 Tax=Bremerella cremea TaxID=1031537 RepID=A0A368KJ44_9BACT|nr:hypothetical protein [Bremerella cremea]RCS40583.1 hypothetical protein DTL42_24745 [Bremerella cremea]